MITSQEVRHIAKLAKLKLTNDEVKKFTKQLGDILDFFSQLQEVKTDHVRETSQVTGLENILRSDEIEVSTDEDELLNCTPHRQENHSIKIPKIL
jgi:aspartyl-tRNA(Asn)/glutamyl-tRNA(Gln) amidotransferase subunit C